MVVTVASRLEAVTVYARGARITRIATVSAPVPPCVRFAGLPLALVDDSVRVEVVGPAIASSLHADVESPATRDDAAAEEPDDLRAARRRLALGDAERERIDAALAQLAAAPLIAADPTDEPPAAWDAVVAARTALVTARTTRELQLRDRLIVARQEQEASRLALELLVEREARATTARAAKIHELRKVIDVELVAAPGSADGAIEIRLEYQVRAARWAPSYVARLDDGGARVEMRAVVAQSSGEDWVGARLVLSTAEPAQLAELPELAPQRIGRRQDMTVRRGFRAPPAGAEALYADFDRTRTRKLPPAPPPPPPYELDAGAESLADEVWDDSSSHNKEAFATPPLGSPMPATPMSYAQPQQQAYAQAVAKSAPMSAADMSGPPPGARSASMGRGGAPSRRAETEPAKKRRSMLFGMVGEGGGGGAPPRDEPAPVESAPRLDYTDLRMPLPSAASRGRLEPAPRNPFADAITRAIRETGSALLGLALPRGCFADWAHTFDYAFAADGRIDVPSDAAWHSLAITAKAATVALRHVTVPREQTDVFRVAAIANPFEGPLLPGPIDVYDRGQFLVTSEVDATPPGGKVEIGLGVDATVKVARNIEYREEATGMLRGGLRLIHGVSIDVENLSARPLDLEVRERVPVSVPNDDAVEVTITRVEPAWERWTPDPTAPADERLRGGHRWRVAVAPKAKAALRLGYEIKIASKLELVGGNRREA